MFDIGQVRSQFPVLNQEAHAGVPLVYLDSAATSLTPEPVVMAMNDYYRKFNANVHRGLHRLSEDATEAYEGARARIAEFINSPSPEQIVFVRNTTEGINLITHSWGRANISAGDEIVLTEMEHHSNIVPWQMLAQEVDAVIKYIPFDESGNLDLSSLGELLGPRTKVVSFTSMSNVFGTITPAKEIVAAARAVGALTVIDAAQSVPHMATDVQDLDCDLLAFSGHKMLGPTGIGVLYGKREILESMPPFLGGGDMISRVELGGSSYSDIPYKFEAGTPAIAEVIGLGAAVDFLTELGMDSVRAHEAEIVDYAIEALSEIPGVTVLGPAASQRGGVAAMTIEGIHPHDIAQILDMDGIAVRAGHHCAMPLHEKLCIPASARASFYVHTTREEIDALVASLNHVRKVFRR